MIFSFLIKVAESSNGEWFATVEGTAVGLWKVSNSSNTKPKLILWDSFPIDFPNLKSNEHISLAVSNSCLVAVSHISVPSPHKKGVCRDMIIINKTNETRHNTLIIKFNYNKFNNAEKIDDEQLALAKWFTPSSFDRSTRGIVRFLSGGERLAVLGDKNLQVFSTSNWNKIYEIEIPFNRALKELEPRTQIYVLVRYAYLYFGIFSFVSLDKCIKTHSLDNSQIN